MRLSEWLLYDRLTAISHQFNANTAVTIAEYSYNELGQLVDKNLGKLAPVSFLQSVDLRYNIRGWLKGINNTSFTNDGYNEETNDVFGMEILYNTAGDFGNTTLANGKVSGMKWIHRTGNTSHPFINVARSYTYEYDKLGQLKNALFKANSGAGWTYRNDFFSEKNITYDLNGNILTLERNAIDMGTGAMVLMDKLNYTYKNSGGNDQLQTVDDVYGAAGNYGFKGTSAATEEYLYDVNGRLKEDKNRNLVYSYNELGKVASLTISGGTTKYIYYNYDGGGQLLNKQVLTGGTTYSNTNYLDNFVAEGNTLSYINHAEGRLKTAAVTYEYYIKDQQGNVRVSFENQGGVATVVQENSYYAFGLVHNATVTPSLANKELYNGGSEWQNDFGNDPDLMNTPFRQYDPVLGRFNGIDPLADQFADMSGYSYAFNDPITYNDPTGAYPDMGYYDQNGRYVPPANWWRPAGAYQNESLEEWFMTPGQKWLREAYYSAGMGSFYDQTYGFIGRDYREINNNTVVKNADGSTSVYVRPATRVYTYNWTTPINFDYTKKSLDWGGGILGASSTLLNHRDMWLGRNGNYYPERWGGNGATGGRTMALKMSKVFSFANKATIGLTVVVGLVEAYQGYQKDGKFGFHTISSIAGTVGGISGGYLGGEAGTFLGTILGGVKGSVPGAMFGAATGGLVGGVYGGKKGGDFGEYAVKIYFRDYK